MKEFIDTSVFVSAFWRGHPSHERSLAILSAADPSRSGCALHSLAEAYATMTALPIKSPISPEQAVVLVEEIRARCRLVSLSERDYVSVLDRATSRGFTSGMIYDALHLQCAIKSRAQIIYTWNLKHFRAIRPDLADRIRTP